MNDNHPMIGIIIIHFPVNFQCTDRKKNAKTIARRPLIVSIFSSVKRFLTVFRYFFGFTIAGRESTRISMAVATKSLCGVNIGRGVK